MRIGIVGAGNIGTTAARLLVAAGHEVALANSRGPETLADTVAELGASARAATVRDACAFGDVVLVSVPLHAIDSLPADALAGRIVVDSNNYYPGRDGAFDALDTGATTSSELLARHLGPEATVVKAFNTMYFVTLGEEARPQAPRAERLVLFVAGDDADAKATVGGLIEDIGFAAVDTGSLAEGGARQQPGTALYNRPMKVPEAERVLASG